MLKKHSVLIGMVIGVSLLIIATTLYPGGSMVDKHSVGFSWSQNFFSHLFAAKAVNGADNPARWWADAGMFFLSLGFALFFITYSKRLPQKSAANVVKYCGVIAMISTVLIVTPLHDIMVNISGTLQVLCIFYITVFIVRSKLHLFKFLCILCMLITYFTFYLYGAGKLDWLPIMQKLTFGSMILLILGLQYFTTKEDLENNSKAIKAASK